MRAQGRLLLRGIRWRLGISLLTVLTSAIAVGAAALGPLYLQTAGDSVVRTVVSSASIEDRGASLSASHGAHPSLARIAAAEQAVVDSGGRHRWYGTPITSVLSGVIVGGPRSGMVRAQLFFRSGVCGAVHFRAGGCDLASGHVAISDRSARELGVSLGSILEAHAPGQSKPIPLTISGIYVVPNLQRPYWWGGGAGYFPFGETSGAKLRLPAIDSLIASASTALAVPPQDAPEITGQVALRTPAVGLRQETAVRRAISGASRATAAHGIVLSTQLPALLSGADSQRHEMSTIVAVAAVQLLILAIWVLVGLLIRSSDARRAEIRVARLRGFPPRSLLAAAALEPAILCGLGFVLGIGAAWAAVVLARGAVLDPHAAISVNAWVFASLGVSVLVIAGALALGTLRLLRSSGLSAAPTAQQRTRSAAHIADAVLLALSAVAIIALATNGSLSGHNNPIASAAPGLIALGTAVLAVQLVLLVCRLGVSASVHSGRIASFLALRQIVRRPTVIRQTRVLVIALCLACFAVSAWSVARTNRAAAATFSVGTAEVATVTPREGGVEQAVDHADPHGRFAMAAAVVATPSSNVLAVDATRLAAVLPWPRGLSRASLSQVTRRLIPSTAAPVNLPPAPLRLQATTTSSRPGMALGSLVVAVWVFNPRGGTAIVELGRLHRGRWTYGGSLASVCPGVCRLVGVGLVPAPGQSGPTSGTVRFAVTGASVRAGSAGWRAIDGALYPKGWRSTLAGASILGGGRGRLTLSVAASAAASYAGAAGFATPPMVAVDDHPAFPPAVVTSELEAINGGAAGGGVPIDGLDGNALSARAVAVASALPRLGSDAAMVDLDLLSRYQVNPTSSYVSDQVWLGPGAPSDALARLRAAGLEIHSVQRAADVFARLQRAAPALADDFLLIATIVALLAAAASTLSVLGANSRERATELTALEAGGVPRRALAGSMAVESTVLAATALFGAGAGVLAAIMTIPSLPELGISTSVPLRYGLPGGWVAAVSLALLVVIALTSAAVITLVVRRMSPVLLRIAPNDGTG